MFSTTEQNLKYFVKVSLNSTSKCNFLFPKEYIIGCFKSKTFPWPII